MRGVGGCGGKISKLMTRRGEESALFLRTDETPRSPFYDIIGPTDPFLDPQTMAATFPNLSLSLSSLFSQLQVDQKRYFFLFSNDPALYGYVHIKIKRPEN